jgi:prolyl-tRNA synthetase
VVIGERGLKEGVAEYQHRRDTEATKVPLASVAAHVRERIKA